MTTETRGAEVCCVSICNFVPVILLRRQKREEQKFNSMVEKQLKFEQARFAQAQVLRLLDLLVQKNKY